MSLTGQALHMRLEPPRGIASDMLTVYGRYTGLTQSLSGVGAATSP